jgi:hypothetical protein
MDDPSREIIESAGVDVPAIEREHRAAQFSRMCSDFVRQAEEEEYDEVRAQFLDEEIHLEDGRVPYVHVQDGKWELRFFPPAHVEIHHVDAGRVRWFSLFDHAGLPAERLSSITMNDLRRYLAWQVKRIAIPRRSVQDRGFGEPEM